MVVDFVEVLDGSNDMSTNMSFAVKSLHSSPYSAVSILFQFRFCWVECVHLILIRLLAIHPLLDFDDACPIVDFVGYVGGLCGDVANLSYEGDLTNVVAIYLEVCVWVWLVCIKGLLDGDGSDGVLAICLQRRGSAVVP